MSEQEGIIKYQSHWDKQPSHEWDVLGHLLLQGRQQLSSRAFIGVDKQGIGYGNISLRWHQKDQFIITGSQTGHLPKLSSEHLSLVTDFNVEKNELYCQGPINPSSEAMSHGVIYRQAGWVNCVIHIHHERLWHELINKAPTISATAAYGTQEMAQGIAEICEQAQEKSKQIIVMAGHQPGLIVFGDAMQRTIDYLLGFNIPH